MSLQISSQRDGEENKPCIITAISQGAALESYWFYHIYFIFHYLLYIHKRASTNKSRISDFKSIGHGPLRRDLFYDRVYFISYFCCPRDRHTPGDWCSHLSHRIYQREPGYPHHPFRNGMSGWYSFHYPGVIRVCLLCDGPSPWMVYPLWRDDYVYYAPAHNYSVKRGGNKG